MPRALLLLPIISISIPTFKYLSRFFFSWFRILIPFWEDKWCLHKFCPLLFLNGIFQTPHLFGSTTSKPSFSALLDLSKRENMGFILVNICSLRCRIWASKQTQDQKESWLGGAFYLKPEAVLVETALGFSQWDSGISHAHQGHAVFSGGLFFMSICFAITTKCSLPSLFCLKV